MSKPTVLITGANGQIGSVLVDQLIKIHGSSHVIASDIRPSKKSLERFEIIDVLDKEALLDCVQSNQIDEIYHLAAILSAVGEQKPFKAWEINMKGLFNVLEVAKTLRIKLFFPSSIAVFGGHSPKDTTPQFAVKEPETVYGISKSAGELWCRYFYLKFGVDVRSIRFPGIIGYQSLPGGGTTDYAVEIFHQAIQKGSYTCFLKSDTALPMIFMDDAIGAIIKIMSAPADNIKIRTSYNIASMSFTPAILADTIRRHLPDFKIDYAPDYRQQIADSWPSNIDDLPARTDWGWTPTYDLPQMTAIMLDQLKKDYQKDIAQIKN